MCCRQSPHRRWSCIDRRSDGRRSPQGRAIADGIPGAKFIELPGADHLPVHDPNQIIDEIEEFLTGHRAEREPERMLATVMFTDIVDSTARASEIGDLAGGS